jgi:hypothetical protein
LLLFVKIRVLSLVGEYSSEFLMMLTKPFFIRALEAFATLDVDLNMVEKAKREEYPPWLGDNMENIITWMMAVPKGTGIARLKAELEQTIEEDGLQKFTRVYTDRSIIEDRVGVR